MKYDTNLGHKLVDAILDDFPDRSGGPHDPSGPKLRPVHSFGMGATGMFRPSMVASDFAVAAHLTRPTPVTVRFSNGSGNGTENDEAPDVHGMAVKFHPDGAPESDLIAMTLGVFFAQNVEQFLDLSKAGVPTYERRESWWRRLLDTLSLRQYQPDAGGGMGSGRGLLQFADRHRAALPGIIGNATIYSPSSWARASYHAVHAFGVHGPDEVVRWVRFKWDPVAGIHPFAAGSVDPEHPRPHRLRTDLADRLERSPVRFLLRMTISETGDAIDDPTSGWPLWRRTIVMGELVLDTLVADQHDGCERLSFNPARLPPGIEPPVDGIIEARKFAYEASCERRDGVGCPMGSAT